MLDGLLRLAVPFLVYAYMTFVGWTTRVRWLGLEHVQALDRRGSNFIYAFWHSRQVFFTWTHRGVRAAVLVSRSKDGEIIARVMDLSGLIAVRGSSSRGGSAALRELMDLCAAGVRPGFTPDGPRGPAGRVKSGVLFLAQKSGLPIVPISNASSRRLILRRSWDGFQVPLPFARACVTHGRPLVVSPGDDLEAKARELERALDEATRQAEAHVDG